MGRGSRYSDTYKREAVAKANASGNVSQTARELGVSYKSLLRWQKDFAGSELPDETATTSADLAARVQQLERELAVRTANMRPATAGEESGLTGRAASDQEDGSRL
jgi:transposase-like protein